MIGERVGSVAPSERGMLGLFFIQRYRFLTVVQFARAAGLKKSSASELLLRYERQKLLGSFGNVGIRGYGKTPKVYYLKPRGYNTLVEDSGIPEDMIGPFRETHVSSKWSPTMYHRLATLDLLIAAEVGVRARSHLDIVETFIEYRRVKRDGQWVAETTDYVTDDRIPHDRIVPDAGMIIENIEKGARALFLIETDMGTERITSQLPRGKRLSLSHKMIQYDRYLASGRFAKAYQRWGDFPFFTVLFVTTADERIANMRRELGSGDNKFHQYYRLNTFDVTLDEFFNDQWLGRASADHRRYRIISEG